MLRTITDLVPFGEDSSARPINVYYLANFGPTLSSPAGFNYLIAYYENASAYGPKTRVFKFITGWDRMKSNLELKAEIFKEADWTSQDDIIVGLATEQALAPDYTREVISLFDSRAEKDIQFKPTKINKHA